MTDYNVLIGYSWKTGADPGLWKGGAQGHRGCEAAENLSARSVKKFNTFYYI